MINLEVSPEAFDYIKKRGGKVIVLLKAYGCCGGASVRLPSAIIATPSSDNSDRYYAVEKDGITVYLPNDLQVKEENSLIIDVEKFLFLKKLAVKGVEQPPAGCSCST